jgi:membrane-bound ClpP family serine protease
MLIVGILLIIGIILVVVEVILVPGTTFVGILGIILLAFGVFQVYQQFGNTAGHYALVITTLLCILAIIQAFRTDAWGKLALNKQLKGRVNELEENRLAVGMIGRAISFIRPAGTVDFDGYAVEVQSEIGAIDSGKLVKITKIDGNKVTVTEVSQILES